MYKSLLDCRYFLIDLFYISLKIEELITKIYIERIVLITVSSYKRCCDQGRSIMKLLQISMTSNKQVADIMNNLNSM